ncbi:alpha/beta hydrolase [Pantoea sp. ME81]|uniref:alpha/beta hydrolase n=1 Tax=Pantoea sp. ME81 TaxID=2743935 RepID=UPI0015F59242|nr:alpha/beta hydrolase [Pantoea sp. ME81]
MLKTFAREGLQLSYFDSGGSGPMLIFQHGLTGDHQQTTSTFTASGYRLITLECRGHGRSSLGAPEALSIRTFADDLLALMDHLAITQAPLAGISMGAALCANIASRHPQRVKCLTLIRPAWHQTRSPLNMNVYNVLADYWQLYGGEEGKLAFAQSETYQLIQQHSPDNANSLLNTFSLPSESTLHLLRRIACCDPGYHASAIKAAQIPVAVAGTAMDVVHPMNTAEVIARELTGKAAVMTFAKSKDKTRHCEEVTELIVSNIKRLT